MADAERFTKGLEVCHKVLTADDVGGSLALTDDFTMALQRIASEYC